ncbi:MAG: hypothetical protein ACJ76D_09265 [Solirubrobacterales bacterium]
MHIPRPKLSYANVIATIALFVALGGAAVAAGLPKNSVGTKQLKRGAVTAAKLKRGAVTSGKIAPKAVTAGRLGANAVLPGNLGNGIINTEKLSDQAVNAAKLKNGAVTTNKLNNGAVTAAKLGDGSVTAVKLADGSVTIAKLGQGVIGQLQGKLESGQTLRGVFDLGDGTEVARQGITFQYPLTNLPDASEANVLDAGGSTTACPGLKGTSGQTPEAAPGQLCLYIRGGSGHISFDTETVSRLGFGLLAKFSPPQSDFRVFGYWAVTAP